MKKMILWIALVMPVGIAQGQKMNDDDVPAAVKNSFAKRFPGASKVSWSKESTTAFEAEFKNKGNEQSANFDQIGNWLGTETEIKKSELPAVVDATINKEFPGYKVEKVELSELPSSEAVYEIELEKGEAEYEAQISKEGKLIKKEAKKETDNDNG